MKLDLQSLFGLHMGNWAFIIEYMYGSECILS